MTKIPKIGIVSSLFKSDAFIASFFADITRQTIFSECELILISPGLSDYEHSIIELYKSKYSNIRCIEVHPDPGLYGCWNVAISDSVAPYITNANLDDRRHPYALERHLMELEVSPTVDLVYAPCLLTVTANESFEANSSPQLYPCYEFDGVKGLLRHNSPHCAPMWRKSIHDKYGKFDSSYKSAGDHEMWLRAASQGSRFKMIPEPLCLYYFNPQGISTSPEKSAAKMKEEKDVREKYKL